MSNEDIKMSDVFELPISYDFDFRDEYGIDHRVVQDANNKDVISDDTQLSVEQAKSAIHAINNHDPMALRIKELEAALQKVLDDHDIGLVPRSHLNTIEKLLEQSK